MLVLFVVCLYAKIHTSPDIVRVLVLGFSFYFVSCSETDYIQYIQYGGKAQDFRVEAVEGSFSDPNSTTNHNLLVYYANSEEQQKEAKCIRQLPHWVFALHKYLLYIHECLYKRTDDLIVPTASNYAAWRV